MAASNPLINSPHPALGRHSDMPYTTRPKRSDSLHFDPADGPRGLFDTSRFHEVHDESTFMPTSLGEHLLERTYLDDVVRPLVRALVKARMTYASNGEGPTESSQAYADLEQLRHELERSAQRARNAELERDDLARRLDLAAGHEPGLRDRHDRQQAADHTDRGDQLVVAPRTASAGLKRPRPSEVDALRGGAYDQRSSAPGSTGVSVNVAHGEGPASITVTTEGPTGAPLSSRPHHAPGADHMSPPMSFAHPGAPRHRPYPGDMHHDSHDPDQRHMARLSHHPDPDYSYADERADRYGLPSAQSAHRPSFSRFAASARSPPTSSSYLTSASERSSMPALTAYPSTSSSSSYSVTNTPYASAHPYDGAHDMEEMERSRKFARLRPGDSMDHHHSIGPVRPSGGTPASNYIITPTNEVPAYPVRKLASTKNRTCSNCAAPHDAKFRRGPNGPGTLCDRCGSRWKKFKEQESSSKRDSIGGNAGNGNAAASAAAAAHARLSSASASSESPMEPSGNAAPSSFGTGASASGGSGESNRNSDGSIPSLGSAEGAVSNGKEISPRDGVAADAEAEAGAGGRERSASVDQLVDD